MTARRARWLVGLALPLAAGGWWLAAPLALPPADTPSLTLTDRNGLVLRATRAADGSRSNWLALDAMDPQLIQAFVAAEDRRFFRHHGVDPRAAARALLQDLRARRVVSGASTITMQLARLLQPSGRGVAGKLAQSLRAVRLEAHLSKAQILEQYLNRVPLGNGTVGVPAAAAFYFGASAARLSLGQAALLAAMASSPAAANPLASAPRAGARRRMVLGRMVALGYADAGAAARAAAEPLRADGARADFLAPHFTSRVLAWAADSAVNGVVRTSLDLALQAELEAEVRHTVALLRDDEVREAAAVVLDNASGEVLAWVGSPDFWADSAGQVDMVASPRQPGSALKPFLYALAFDHGVTAATVLPDEPRIWRTATGPYQPRNYDRRFHGPVRARDALASSFNIPAVELTDRLGAGALLHALHRAGFASLTAGADRYGLGLALGNGDVTLLELANGYRGLALGGSWRPVRFLAAPPGPAGAGDAAGRRFAGRGAALLVLDVLSDPVARIPGFGTDTPFDFAFPVAVKTGTSHHFTDNWAVGVTGAFTVAAWVGNFSGRPMRRVSGVTGAGPLLHRAVLAAARRLEPGLLPSPAEAGATRVRICRDTGERADGACPATDEWFLPGTAPERAADAPGARAWRDAHETPARTLTSVGLDRTDAPGGLEITSPLDGDRYEIPPGVERRYATIPLRASGASGPVRWLVDGAPVAGERWALASGTHEVQAVSASGQRASARITVR